MSENVTPNENPELTPPSELSKAVEQTIPKTEPSSHFGFMDTHTPQNTPMKEVVEPLNPITKELVEDDRVKGFTSIFLGVGKEENEKAAELITNWSAWNTFKELNKVGEVSPTVFASAKQDWDAFVQENYPDVNPSELEKTASDLFKFMNSLQENLQLRTRMVREENITNASRRCDKLTTTDIVGKTPSVNKKGLSIADRMIRSTIRSSGGVYQYNQLLRNSFLSITWERPQKLEVADLINNINRRIRGYVRRVGGNAMALSYIAGYIEIWDWLKPRLVSSSVKGLADFDDLSKVIRITDMPVICAGLLASITDDGVQMDLRCMNPSCDWYQFDLIDPTKLVQRRPSIETDEEAAFFGNIFSGREQHTVDEILKMIEQSTYGMDNRYVYNEDQSIRLKVGPPSLSDAFATFDYFVGRVDKQLADISNKVNTEQDLEEQRLLLLNSLSGAEYMHWVEEFAIMPPPGEDSEPQVIKRAKEDPNEFNKGLMDSLLTDEVMNKNLVLFVYNKAPYLTRTFIGVRNFVCPKCGTESDAHQEDRKLGYTPIDAFMSFFIHSQLMLMNLAMERQKVNNEALS